MQRMQEPAHVLPSVCPCHSPALEGAEGPSRGQCPHLLPLKTCICHRQAFWLHMKIIWEYPSPRHLLSRLSGCEPGCGGEVPQGLPSPARMDNLPEGSLASVAPSRWVWRSSSSRLWCRTSSGEKHPWSHSDRGPSAMHRSGRGAGRGAEVQRLLLRCVLGWVSKQAVHQRCVVPQRLWSCLWIAAWLQSRKCSH